MLPLEAKRPGHTAAARVEDLIIEAKLLVDRFVVINLHQRQANLHATFAYR